MKTKTTFLVSLGLLLAMPLWAQDRTTVNATSSEISDNLDLRAIASIFGQAKNLEDFERQLNDPNTQLSNLDLNEDNKVDYLRVIESAQDNIHLIVVQAVLGKDLFQDVATIEVEKDRHNQVQVQVVGDVYMYGENYIYEPVYVTAPVIYNTFWIPRYRPYCSAWYWGYYPTYYYAWTPFPVFRYRHNIAIHINFHNHYNYVTTRRCTRAIVMHQPIRANHCERYYPTRAFAYRNNSVKNSYELDRTRTIRNVRYPNDIAYNDTRTGRNNDPIKQSIRSETPEANTRSNGITKDPIRQSTRNETPKGNVRYYNPIKQSTPSDTPAGNIRNYEPIKQSTRSETLETNTRNNGFTKDPIRQSVRNETSAGNVRNYEPIKQSTRNETTQNGRQRPDYGTSSNAVVNPSYGGQRTRPESNNRYERSNVGSPAVRNEGIRSNRENSQRSEKASNPERRSR